MRLGLAAGLALGTAGPALAQMGPGGPPAVGVVRVAPRAVTQTNEFIGRVAAENKVDLQARVTGYLEQVLFQDGAEVKKGDPLYRIERPPFEADVAAKQAQVEQYQATLANANLTLQRAQSLLRTPAGQQATVDTALSGQRSQQALLLGAQASLRTSQINLGYTEIKAPIDGKIGQTAVTEGNVVGPTSGTLATIVSQDPIYVTFPVSVRLAIELRQRYAEKGFGAVVMRLVLPDGRTYGPTGKLDFVNNTIQQNTDTITLRGTIPNPVLPDGQGAGAQRELVDGEFVTVRIEGAEPVKTLGVPRQAVLSDQKGDYVYVVDDANKAQRVAVQLGQSTPTEAVVVGGLKEGQQVVVEGTQRVKPGAEVKPGPVQGGAEGAPQASGDQGIGAPNAGASGGPGSGVQPGAGSGGAGSSGGRG